MGIGSHALLYRLHRLRNVNASFTQLQVYNFRIIQYPP